MKRSGFFGQPVVAPGAPVLGMDLGGTMVKGIAAGSECRVLWRGARPTEPGDVWEGLPTGLVELALELYERASTAGAVPQAAGVVVPGVVDCEAGVARFAANLGWRDLPVRDLLEKRLRLPVVLGHDVRAGGLAEGCFGAARGVGDYLFVAIGTGIAGAISLGGRMWAGASLLAGELGHIVVEPGGDRCGCGGTGCLETVSSAAAIARRYAERAGLPVEGNDASRVFQSAEGGDGQACQVVKEAVEGLAAVLASVQSMLDVELIVIGGGLAGAGTRLLEAVGDALAPRLPFQTRPRLALAELGSDAGALGAMLLAQESLRS